MFFEKPNNAVDIILRFFRKINPLCLELIGVFYYPTLVHT